MMVEKFVEMMRDLIDPAHGQMPPTSSPLMAEAGRDVYAVLREAIAKTGKTALSRVVISQRERTIALRPMGDGLMAHTLYEDRDLNSSCRICSTAWPASRPVRKSVQLAAQSRGNGKAGHHDSAGSGGPLPRKPALCAR